MKKLLEAMNKLVFMKPRTEKEVFDIQSLSHEILCDFFLTAEYIRTARFEFGSPFFGFVLEYMDKRIRRFVESKTAIGYAMSLSSRLPYGCGFTPRLATREKYPSTIGFNCLGKAIVLGMYLQGCQHSYKVFLGLTFGTFTDHGLIILQLKNNYFLCDTEEIKLKKLHGEFRDEKGYTWYEKSPKDNFRFNCIVIQNFNLGIINAIIGHFIFLQKKSLKDVPETDRQYMTFKDKKFKLSTVITRTPWQKIQNQYFKDLNQYREKYREKYITECFLVDMDRQSSELKAKFDKIIKSTFEKVFKTEYTSKKHKDLFESYIPILQLKNDKVIKFLDGGPYLGLHLPRNIHLYLKTLRNEISKDKVMKGFAIRRFKERLKHQ